jgi:meiotically up-regulated gene 157 (Mug157) protein
MRETGLRSALLEGVVAELEPLLRPVGLSELFSHALRNTLETTVTLEEDTAFAVTGDIPAMWLRDSTGQVLPYLRFCRTDPLLRQVVRGVVLRQARCILIDQYANAFAQDPTATFALRLDVAEQHPGVWERKWEVDAPCWVLRLLRCYAQATGDLSIYAEQDVRAALATILTTFEMEREHTTRSGYSFRRPLPGLLYHDSASSHPVGPTGMIWSAFRPSDDGCMYNYLIPSQMLAVVELGELARTFDAIYRAPRWVERARSLADTIAEGIERYGVVEHPMAGRIYAYEVDGLGHYNLMDDANLPSLLGIPEIGYRPADDPIYLNTRQFVLSQANPYYYEGHYAAGIGSAHTPAPYIWPTGLIVQALTSTDAEEVGQLLQTIKDTDGGTRYIHESFDPNDPRRHTRSWFAWGNALFAELVLRAYYDGAER